MPIDRSRHILLCHKKKKLQRWRCRGWIEIPACIDDDWLFARRPFEPTLILHEPRKPSASADDLGAACGDAGLFRRHVAKPSIGEVKSHPSAKHLMSQKTKAPGIASRCIRIAGKVLAKAASSRRHQYEDQRFDSSETVSLWRPFARRDARTRRPFLVAIRERNPCLFARLRRLGWYVRFILVVVVLNSGAVNAFVRQNGSQDRENRTPQF
jgi:hypothetical protein